ncbi:MAG: energy-coupling factor transporter transmembrane protein EcfT [Clostridia bacterium]|nr:energy-coupling factor transporter transmembrane protein EcfT [Clostridia bacterium]
MSGFKGHHPIVNFVYFVFVIGFSCFLMHPVCLAVSLASGFAYSVILKGSKAVRTSLIYMLPMLIIMALINPIFNHEGVTVLWYLPNGNPLTLESIVYGLFAAVMIASVICHFTCYHEVMTSDKFIYLFGRIIPAMSLILSMTLRFVPNFAQQLKVVTNAHRCIGRDVNSGGVIKRAKHGLTILSIMATWSLENAIETADSMKSRGYGLPGRTSFSIFTFDKRDKQALIIILISGTYTLVGSIMGGIQFDFFPMMTMAEGSWFGITIFAAHLLLCIYPVIIDLCEVRKWKAIQSKI